MRLCTLRKTIGGHFRIGSFCYAFVYPDTFAYGNLLCVCVPFVKHFRIGSLCYAFVYPDTFAYGNLLCVCVPFGSRQSLLCVCVPGHFCIRKFTMRLCTLRKTIGGHFRIGNLCYAFVYPDTFAYGIYYAFVYPS